MYWIILLLLVGCSPGSLQDFQKEGESRSKEILSELQKIENRDQLVRAENGLKKQFEKLVALMIQAREYQSQHPEEEMLDLEENEVSAALKEELRRIYSIEGGREIIERAQQEALVALDAYQRALIRQREKS